MYCTKCGHQLVAEDKFCSGCGAKVIFDDNGKVETVEQTISTTPDVDKFSLNIDDNEPLFEPFDFKAFGFDFENLGLGEGVDRDEKTGVPEMVSEEFNWNTGEFPDRNVSKTDDIDFNWSLTPDESKKEEPVAEPKIVDEIKTETTQVPEVEVKVPDTEPTSSLEQELFGDLNDKTDETRKQSEEIDKFFTFHQKNEEFQKILDREYEKVKSGNILTEEINAAEVASEEKFTERQPEDPMEAMFEAEGVIKGYEPKPIETDVLERIEAAEQEKKIKEEAEKLIEIEREKASREAEAVSEDESPKEESTEEPVEEVSAEEENVETVEVETIDTVETVEVEEADQETETVAEAVPSETENADSVTPVHEEQKEEDSFFAADEEKMNDEEEPVKTKQVDKAAILAGMAVASEMVERDRAFAAAQAAEAAEQEAKIELPDFLGHEEAVEEAIEEDAPVETEKEPQEAESAEIQEETPEDDGVEFDIFEQLEDMEEEAPVEEIVLPEEQTIEELFADIAEDVSKEPQKSFTEHTLVLTEDSVAEILNASTSEPVAENTSEDTMVFTAHTLGAILAEAEASDPDAEEVVVSMEDLIAAENAVSEGTAAAEKEKEKEEEEVVKGGKGRLILKIFLVILIILLLIEVAGIGIKIFAPTSEAADYIDVQIKKVFDLLSVQDQTVTALNDSIEANGMVYKI